MTRHRKIASLIFASALSAMLALLLGFSGLWYSPARGSWSSAMTIQQLSIPYWKNVSGNETIIYNEIVTENIIIVVDKTNEILNIINI